MSNFKVYVYIHGIDMSKQLLTDKSKEE